MQNETTKKPSLCEVLGVEVGEHFRTTRAVRQIGGYS